MITTGDADKLYHDGCSYKHIDEDRAKDYFKLSAEAGNPNAMIEYAKILSLNSTDGLYWAERSAELGNGEACYLLGLHYTFDFNTPRNCYVAGQYHLKSFYAADNFLKGKKLELSSIIEAYMDRDVYFEDEEEIVPIAKCALDINAISKTEYEEVVSRVKEMTKYRIAEREARTCPKCHTGDAHVEKNKPSKKKRAAIGAGIGLVCGLFNSGLVGALFNSGLVGALVGMLVGAAVGALVGKHVGAVFGAYIPNKQEYCTCMTCGKTWKYKPYYYFNP